MKPISKLLFSVPLLVCLSLDSPVALTYARIFRRAPMEIRDRFHFDLRAARSAAAKYHATILVFSLGDPNSYLRVVTANDVGDFTLPAGSQIDGDVNRYVRMMAAPPRDSSAQDYKLLSTKLYQTLLRPAEHLLKAKRLLVVPDASLSLLPFETLISDPQLNTAEGSRFIGQDFTISYAPSVPEFLSIVERSQRASSPTKGILIYADPVYEPTVPRLMSTRDEALSIQRLFPSQTLLRLGPAATKQSITDGNLADYRIIHFAMHGFSEDTGKSGLVLSQGDDPSQDGLLTAHDVANLNLHASLIVLSACQTGATTDGSLGLTNAFLKAGAQEVVASLWAVNDFSGTDFMKMYYTRMREGESPSDALRSAKLDMMQSRIPYAHPHYWAPFIHVGAF